MSFLRVTSAPAIRNQQSAIFVDVVDNKGLTPIGHDTASTLKRDIGVDIIEASDKILLTALHDPKQFIESRIKLMDILALETVKFGAVVYGSVTEIIADFPASILNDIIRNISAKVLSDIIQGIEGQIGGVNELVLNKLSNV